MPNDNCVPDLPENSPAYAHYYDDTEKFNICLPTKTGSTSWTKFLYALSIDHGKTDPADIDDVVVFQTPEMPRGRNELRKFLVNRTSDNRYKHM